MVSQQDLEAINHAREETHKKIAELMVAVKEMRRAFEVWQESEEQRDVQHYSQGSKQLDDECKRFTEAADQLDQDRPIAVQIEEDQRAITELMAVQPATNQQTLLSTPEKELIEQVSTTTTVLE